MNRNKQTPETQAPFQTAQVLSQRTQSTRRIVWIDALKGFATVLVVLGHIADGYLHAGMFPADSGLLEGLYNGIYAFHMALFFSVSGMTFRLAYFAEDGSGKLTLKDPSGSRFRTQLWNLALLYVFYCVLMGAFKILASRFVNQPVSVLDILLIWGKPIPPYWYLYVLAVFYLLFSRDFLLNWRHNAGLLLTALLVASLVSGFCDTRDWFQIMHILRYALFFYLGIRVAEAGLPRLWAVLPCAALSLAAIALFWKDGRFITGIPVVSTLAALGVVLLLLLLFGRLPVFGQSRLLSFLGRHSLEIYVLHCFFTAGNRVLLPRLGIRSLPVSIAANLVLSIGVPILISAAARKLKLYNLLFAPGKLLQQSNMTK